MIFKTIITEENLIRRKRKGMYGTKVFKIKLEVTQKSCVSRNPIRIMGYRVINGMFFYTIHFEIPNE